MIDFSDFNKKRNIDTTDLITQKYYRDTNNTSLQRSMPPESQMHSYTN